MEEVGNIEVHMQSVLHSREQVFDACKMIIGSSALKREMEKNPDIYDGADPRKMVMIRHISSSRSDFSRTSSS